MSPIRKPGLLGQDEIPLPEATEADGIPLPGGTAETDGIPLPGETAETDGMWMTVKPMEVRQDADAGKTAGEHEQEPDR